MKPSKSATIFILDLLILYGSFFGVFAHYEGFGPISYKANILMVFVALMWFIIAVNSSIVSMSIETRMSSIFKVTLLGYSVLSVSVIGVVSVFGEFAPNNKLILWPLLLGLYISSVMRFVLLVCAKHFVRQGYQ